MKAWLLTCCLFDDRFMQMCASDGRIQFLIAAWILRAIIGDENHVFMAARLQYSLFLLGGRKLVLDVWGLDNKGVVYNVEIQKNRKGAAYERLDVHHSALLSHCMRAGMSFGNVPTVHVYCITTQDLYPDVPGPITRIYAVPGEYMPDGSVQPPDSVQGKPLKWKSVTAYVDGSYRGDDMLGRMLHDLFCSNTKKMYSKNIRQIVEYTKNPALEEAKQTVDATWQQELNGLRLALERSQRKATKVDKMEKELAKKDSQLAKKDSQLAKKDSQLAKKNSQLAKKDSQLANKDSQLANKDSELAKMGDALVLGLHAFVKSTGDAPEEAVLSYALPSEERDRLLEQYHRKFG